MTERDADSMAEKPETHTEGSGRNPRGTEVGASKVTDVLGHLSRHSSLQQLLCELLQHSS